MSKHHHYHPSHSGSFHTATKKTHLDHHETNVLMSPTNHGSNGLRQNGIVNGDGDSNDTNNNYNKHHTHHKRSAGGGGGEASSSKRTKLSVPSDKNGKAEVVGVRQPQSHYNIMEKLKELYKELKHDKSCKEVR